MQFWFLQKKLWLWYRYQNSTLVSVPDTDTEFRSHTTYIYNFRAYIEYIINNSLLKWSNYNWPLSVIKISIKITLSSIPGILNKNIWLPTDKIGPKCRNIIDDKNDRKLAILTNSIISSKYHAVVIKTT